MPGTNPGIGALIDFAAAPPWEQVLTVEKLRKMYADESSHPWNYYGPFVRGFTRAFASTDPAHELQKVVDEASPAKVRHFQELVDGGLPWLQANRYSLVPVKRAVWSDTAYSFKVAPHIGLTKGAGSSKLAVFLYMKQPELCRQACDVPLWMLKQVQDQTLPGGEPAILEVRRGKLWTLRRGLNPERLDMKLTATVASFAAMWRSVA